MLDKSIAPSCVRPQASLVEASLGWNRGDALAPCLAGVNVERAAINGLVFINVNPYVRQIAIGLILVTVAAFGRPVNKAVGNVVNNGAETLEAAQ